MSYPSLHARLGVLPCLLVLLFLTITACRSGDDEPIKPSEFTKQQREDLGDLIHSAIQLDSRDFSILPKITPYNEIYDVVEKLYDQVTNTMRLDRHSPSDNRWDQSRPWKVGILIDDTQNAFILPGGHLYITTGFLKALSAEHELYYLLAFEASLMNNKYLLNRLITNYNTSILLEVLNSPAGQSAVSPKDMSLTLANLTYEEEDLQEVDEETLSLICETSIFDRSGLRGIYASSLDGQIEWVEFRDYPGRLSLVQQLINGQEEDCGQFTTEGRYEEMVLANLP